MSNPSVDELLKKIDAAIANAKSQDGGGKKKKKSKKSSVKNLLTDFNGASDDAAVSRDLAMMGGKRSKKSKKTKKTKKTKKSKKSKKMSRGNNTFIADMSTLNKFIKEKISGLNHRSMVMATSELLKANDKDLKKAKEAFDKNSYMKLYEAAEKKRASKKN
jgi:hypothetical protein